MSKTMYQAETHIPARSQESILNIRQALRDIALHGDYAGLLDLQESYGDTAVRIEDTTGHYPVSVQPLTDLRTEVRDGRLRFYWQTEGHDAHHPGRQFTVRAHTVGALSVMGANGEQQ